MSLKDILEYLSRVLPFIKSQFAALARILFDTRAFFAEPAPAFEDAVLFSLFLILLMSAISFPVDAFVHKIDPLAPGAVIAAVVMHALNVLALAAFLCLSLILVRRRDGMAACIVAACYLITFYNVASLVMWPIRFLIPAKDLSTILEAGLAATPEQLTTTGKLFSDAPIRFLVLVAGLYGLMVWALVKMTIAVSSRWSMRWYAAAVTVTLSTVMLMASAAIILAPLERALIKSMAR